MGTKKRWRNKGVAKERGDVNTGVGGESLSRRTPGCRTRGQAKRRKQKGRSSCPKKTGGLASTWDPREGTNWKRGGRSPTEKTWEILPKYETYLEVKRWFKKRQRGDKKGEWYRTAMARRKKPSEGKNGRLVKRRSRRHQKHSLRRPWKAKKGGTEFKGKGGRRESTQTRQAKEERT